MPHDSAPNHSSHFDVVIIGAGMAGLAAGIRLAYFDKRVCILERHYAYGGLNSYYRLGGRSYDVGLHALTNFVPPDKRAAPLNKALRQLRLTRDELDLCEQKFSQVRFPGCSLKFTNDVSVLESEVARAFPDQSVGFARLLEVVRGYDDTRLDVAPASARRELARWITDPMLREMLLCPLMYYGNAQPADMEFLQFVIMFKALYLEGFSRPRAGVRGIIRALVRKFRGCGGLLKMRCGVQSIEVDGGRAVGLRLDDGQTISTETILSSAGYVETMRLCAEGNAGREVEREAGVISFVESIAVTDILPADLGHEAAIVFFNDAPAFTYDVPEGLVDLRSGVFCCPSNYDRHDDMAEGIVRVTWLADARRWAELDEGAYVEAKATCGRHFSERCDTMIPGISGHVLARDLFTPSTIRRFTGHINGAVYGAPRKRRDGRTGIENLFLCGTDQGYLGIIGAMLSGITMANMHVLANEG
ncbi:MAG: phytoene desaturase family protein [Phycisphaerae bacterium]